MNTICPELDRVNLLADKIQSESIKYQAIFSLALYGRLRLGEICGLEWSDIDFENNRITIKRTKAYDYKDGKTEGYTRENRITQGITLSQTVMDILYELKQESNNKVVMTRENGDPIHPPVILHWFSGWLNKNDLPNMTFHELRHMSIELLATHGIDLAVR